MRVAIAWVLLCVASGDALADEGAEPKLIPAAAPPVSNAVRLSHQGQFQISIRLAAGLRAIAPYHDEFCGQTDASAGDNQAAVCTGRSPFSIDFELGYGLGRKVDVFVEMRLGIEEDFGASPTAAEGARVFHFSPGARFFFSDAGKSKLFTTAQAVFDLSGYKNLAGEKLGTDIGLRNLSGLWFDLDKAYGVYLFIGETATFSRWLRFELEGGVGIQGRYR
ncbi:MAG: hypothetical protein ABI867_08605 [Kofleriaceae bacterium]